MVGKVFLKITYGMFFLKQLTKQCMQYYSMFVNAKELYVYMSGDISNCFLLAIDIRVRETISRVGCEVPRGMFKEQ